MKPVGDSTSDSATGSTPDSESGSWGSIPRPRAAREQDMVACASLISWSLSVRIRAALRDSGVNGNITAFQAEVGGSNPPSRSKGLMEIAGVAFSPGDHLSSSPFSCCHSAIG